MGYPIALPDPLTPASRSLFGLAGLATTGISGDLTFTKTGNTARAATFPDANIEVQATAEVISGNWTARNHAAYNVIASATATDPATPAAGHEFTTLVRNGTMTTSRGSYAVSGTLVRSVWHSGSWTDYPYGPLNAANTWTAAQTFQDGGAGLPRTTISQTGDNPIIDQYRWTGGGVLYWASRHILIGADLAWQNAPSATLGAHSFTTRMTLNSSGALILGTDPTGSELLRVGGGLGLGYGGRIIFNNDKVGMLDSSGAGNALHIAPGNKWASIAIAPDGGKVVLGTDPTGSELLRIGGSIRAGQALVLSYAGASIDMPNSGAGSSSIAYGIWAKSSVGLAIRSSNSGRIDFDDGAGSVYMRIGTNMFGIFGSAGSTQITGFGTPTGASRLVNFPGATATLGQTTAALADLIAVLKGYGIVGN